jgi:hypothetical protein
LGVIHSEGIYLINAYKKYRSKIKKSEAIKEHTKRRKDLDADIDREWRDFLRNLRFSEDEVYTLETTEEWLPEDSFGEIAFGC